MTNSRMQNKQNYMVEVEWVDRWVEGDKGLSLWKCLGFEVACFVLVYAVVALQIHRVGEDIPADVARGIDLLPVPSLTISARGRK